MDEYKIKSDSTERKFVQRAVEVDTLDSQTEDGILKMLNVQDIFPFFGNPVKWCTPHKLMHFKKLVELGVIFPPIIVVQEERLIVYDGHYRWFASYLAGKKEISAWVT
ncbi:ParB N-terminal domain-containing protein [Brunnivagina elsteri]|uniref:ParB/Sulfiredoxin domain-containing protein n=1 Tax=Brunnivagina elsteri CCALA 953 TaxID=987040 RepID=A0A2A2TML8_9CYAN|nr:ParB N-terminal domain-containing protein [Calothrix elsteri]PAX59796.1 hypothetical protein CK510_05310 [Calothrix elsteri CCALA 953]